MAAGDTKVFNDYILKSRQGKYTVADGYTLAFLSDTYASISTNATDPVLTDFTVASGGNVATSYLLTGASISRAAEVITLDFDDIATILQDPANPTDLRCALIYDASVLDETMQVFDLTSDGTTPLDLINNDLTFSFNASGVNQSTNQSTT